jgi:hypothetical protein
MKTSIHLLSYPAEFALEWEMFQAKDVEQITLFILCNFSRKLCRLWDNVEIYNRLEWQLKTIGRMMRISRRVTKTANTHSEHVIVIAFPLQQWLNERASVLRYTYIARFVTLNSRANSSCFITRFFIHDH